jgi:cytochrome P450
MKNLVLFGVFVSGIIAYLLRTPPHLRKLPRVSFIKLVKALFAKRSSDEYYSEVLAPALKHRGIASMQWLGRWIIVVSNRQIASQIFRDTSLFEKTKSDFPGLFAKFVGPSNILKNNGEEWKKHRKPANPIFHQKFSPEVFVTCIEAALDSLSDRVTKNQDEPVKVDDLMSYMTLDVLGKGIFSVDFEAIKCEGSSRYYYLYSSIMNEVSNPLYFLIPYLNRYPMGNMAKAYKNLEEFNGFIQSLIDQRRKDMNEHKFDNSKDLLSTLLRETAKNHEDPLTDEELVHNLNVFFVAGHDTTANTLSCGMYYLAKNRHVQDKLRKEIYDTLQIQTGTEKVVIPTAGQIKQMDYLGLFIKEVMRLNPPISQIFRTITEDYPLPDDNIVLPKGTTVNLSIYSAHHDPKTYQNPEKFDPERFLNGKYDTDVYMPFGGGSRMCIGFNFSLMEQKTYLIMLLQRFDIHIKSNNPDFDKLRIKGMGMIKPTDLKLNFEPRF